MLQPNKSSLIRYERLKHNLLINTDHSLLSSKYLSQILLDLKDSETPTFTAGENQLTRLTALIRIQAVKLVIRNSIHDHL